MRRNSISVLERESCRHRSAGRNFEVGLAASVVASLFFLSLPFLGSQAPSTHGWYSSLWSNRDTLYTESYWSLPPAGVFFEGWPRQFHPNFLLIDVVHLTYWALFLGCTYITCRRFAGRRSSFASTVLVGSVAFAQPGNIVSGYFETHYLLGLSALLLATSQKCSSFTRFSVALCLALLSWGTKQTGVLSVFLVLIAYFFSEHARSRFAGAQARRMSFGKDILKFTRIFLLAFVLAFPFLLLGAGGFRQLWASKTTFFGSGGKAPSVQGLLPMFLNGMGESTVIILLSVIVLTLLGRGRDLISLMPVISVLAILFFASAFRPFSLLGRLVAVTILSAMLFDYFANSIRRINQKHLNLFGLLGAAAFPILLIYEFSGWIFRGIHEVGSRDALIGPYWSDASTFSTISLFALFILLAGFSFAAIAPNRRFAWKNSDAREHRSSVAQGDGSSNAASLWIPLLFPVLLAVTGSSFLGGLTLEVIFPISAVGLAVILDPLADTQTPRTKRNIRDGRIFVHGLLSVLILLAGTSWLRQFEIPYNWIGVNGASLTEKFGADGSYISSSGEMYFDRANRFLLHAELNSIPQDEPLLIGPRNVGLTVGSTKEVVFQNCIVLWWDMCPEQEANEDLEALKSGTFKYALWTFEGSDVILGNEFIWRDGRSSAVGQMDAILSEVLSSSPRRALFSMTEDYGSGRETVLIDLNDVSTA